MFLLRKTTSEIDTAIKIWYIINVVGDHQVSVVSSWEVSGRGDVRVMELQSVVVYTVIDIPAPKAPSDTDVETPADGCLSWIKGQIKRFIILTLFEWLSCEC